MFKPQLEDWLQSALRDIQKPKQTTETPQLLLLALLRECARALLSCLKLAIVERQLEKCTLRTAFVLTLAIFNPRLEKRSSLAYYFRT